MSFVEYRIVVGVDASADSLERAERAERAAPPVDREGATAPIGASR